MAKPPSGKTLVSRCLDHECIVFLCLSNTCASKKKRATILTGMGIVLGCALVCHWHLLHQRTKHAAPDVAYSYGSHHYQIGCEPDYLTLQQANQLAANHLVAASGLLIEDEVALPDNPDADSSNQEKNSISLIQRDTGAMELKQYELSQGRLPQNDQECLISTRALEQLPRVYDIGDTLTLSIYHAHSPE